MKNKRIHNSLCHLFMALVTMFTCSVSSVGAVEYRRTEKIALPYSIQPSKAVTYKYLYVVGGYHSIDNGCPAWGTADIRNSRMIGDMMGSVNVIYADGTTESIPLIFGYTMWYKNNWKEASAPFKAGNVDKALTSTLKSALCLLGAFEGKETCVFRIELADKPVTSVVMEDNPDKEGSPDIKGGFLAMGESEKLTFNSLTFNTSDRFFNTHTVKGADPFPQSAKDALNTVNRALMTYEDDYSSAPIFEYPDGYSSGRVYFSGTPFANIASASVYYNVNSILNRVDEKGMLHTSYKNAPSWRYDGFGYWVEKADSYYSSFYSRDGGRALLTLNQYGYITDAERSVKFANNEMMYFPKNKLTIGGVGIPGHYTVVINQPLLYSTVLVPNAGWATGYTKDKFGDEYQNLGNQETDGHGLMMLANYSTWRNLGANADWVENNWEAVNEGAKWIEWCLDNPELSFSKNGILYAESEAGMMQYTLYCNVPCMLGMYGYSEMAEAAGHMAEAAAWKKRADDLKAAIEKRFLRSRTSTWNNAAFGFYHDPTITMLADMFGYDLDTYPKAYADWVKASRKSYIADIATVAGYSYFGSSGIGYNHSMITQNALLTDNMKDATILVENLCRISYSPRLPDSYIIPEGITYDNVNKALRRQGDLGNLVQAAEAMKCFDIVKGISFISDGTLRIIPRLPANWSMNVLGHNVQNSDASADVKVSYPSSGIQRAYIKLSESDEIKNISFRFGPLPADTKYAATAVNGINVPCEFSLVGDSAWVNVTYPNIDGKEAELVVIYSKTLESLGSFPDKAENETQTDTKPVTESQTTSQATEKHTSERLSALIIAVTAAGAALITAAIVFFGIRKKNRKSGV